MMKQSLVSAAAICVLAGTATAQSFSLDDNPSAPITSAPFPGPFSAEDPFGIGLPPVFAGRVGPSPTLGAGYVDGDILEAPAGSPVPVPDVLPTFGTYLNALSADHERLGPNQLPETQIRFSVDRATDGVPGSALAGEYAGNQQAGDIYASSAFFPNPGVFVGALGPGPFAGLLPTAVAGGIGSNALQIDESALLLTAGLGPGLFIPPGVAAPVHTPGSHDNVDAYNDLPLPFTTLDVSGDFVTDVDYFYSLPPAEAAMVGVPSSDIFWNATGFPGGALIPYAFAPMMGLDILGVPPSPDLPQRDDIDALVVWDIGNPPTPTQNQAEPFRDYALFSLAPRSASLTALRAAGFPVDASTVFFTDFSGAFAVFCFGSQLGIADSNVIDVEEANIDALEVGIFEEEKCPGDVNDDGLVSPADFTAWLSCFMDPTSAPFCPCADVNGDGVIDPADFTAWLAAFAAGC